MVKTKDLFRKTGDNQGNISCKDRHDKGQKLKDIIEAKEIKKRQQEYTEELYKKMS